MKHANISAADVAARRAFFEAVAHDLISESVLPETDVIYRGARIAPMTDAYFLLSEAYKKWKIAPEHRTKPFKIAAISCMAIATFRPFVPRLINDVTQPLHLNCNEIFALTCLLAILDNPNGVTGKFNRDLGLRLIDIIRNVRSETLEPFIVDLNHRTVPEDGYNLDIHKQDKFPLNALISICELLAKQFAIAGMLSTL